MSCHPITRRIYVNASSNIIDTTSWPPVTHRPITWWRHQMEAFSALLAFCAGNSPVPVNSPHKGQWRGALMFSLIWTSTNGWVNNREAGDLRRHRAHYDVIVMRATVHKNTAGYGINIALSWECIAGLVLYFVRHTHAVKSVIRLRRIYI